MTTNTSISDQIYLSRDQIRSQIIEYLNTYLELENVDLTKSSFLSFIINILSTLTSNLLFYQLSTYREFFLTKAQLPESIYNLSAFLGYTPVRASYATAYGLITIPFGFDDDDTTFTIPSGFKCYANTIEFVTYYTTTINVVNNSSVTITIVEGQKVYKLPVDVDLDNGQFVFLLPLRQLESQTFQVQVDEDLEVYQFFDTEIKIEGEVSTLSVKVRKPNSEAWTTYTEFNSLYLMSQDDYGYVVRKTDDGIKIYFGNGVIGIQPDPGSTIEVTANITLGEDGNVISGSINKGERIYVTTSGGINQIVDYTIINPSAATGGESEETTEETRRGAIANIAALGRLVTENDYKDTNLIIDNTPILDNVLPVLKRSDLKVNEIQLFTPLQYSGDSESNVTYELIVPTRNATQEYSTTIIPRDTIITIDDVEYYTLFDMVVDTINEVANYFYILYEVKIIPVLITGYGSDYDIFPDQLVVSKIGTTGEYRLHYVSTETDPDTCTCTMEVVKDGSTYSMTNDSTSNEFVYTFDNFLDVPDDKTTYYFTISHDGSPIGQYSATLTFRKTLTDFMRSNVICGYNPSCGDSTSSIIYDIPVIQKEYYDSLTKRDFELYVLQVLLDSLTFSSYRMLTDFTNLKFPHTTGYMRNMQHNEVTKPAVIDIDITEQPTNPSVGDRYIVGCCIDGWEDHIDKIAECTDATNNIWIFTQPMGDDIVYVTNKGQKYIYCESGWVIPEYEIPLQLEIEIYPQTTYTGSLIELSDNVRSAIISAFTSKFGLNSNIYRSEIIDTVMGVSGVSYCRLIKPESNIFFNFELQDLTTSELLLYAPELIYFRTEDISVRIIER
jgi:hypothetical protein